MKLRKFEILINFKVDNPWQLTGLCLNDINLIVGKNTSGKSIMVNQLQAIAPLARASARACNG